MTCSKIEKTSPSPVTVWKCIESCALVCVCVCRMYPFEKSFKVVQKRMLLHSLEQRRPLPSPRRKAREQFQNQWLSFSPGRGRSPVSVLRHWLGFIRPWLYVTIPDLLHLDPFVRRLLEDFLVLGAWSGHFGGSALNPGWVGLTTSPCFAGRCRGSILTARGPDCEWKSAF